MGKVDRCEQLKKESQSQRKKFVQDMRQNEKEQEKLKRQYLKEQEEAKAAEAKARAKARSANGRFEKALQAGKSSSTFSKASGHLKQESDDEEEDEVIQPKNKLRQVRDDDNDDGDDDDEAEEVLQPTTSSLSGGAGKVKETKKQQKKNKHKDEMRFLVQEQRAARRQRIISRLLHIFVIGFFWDGTEERSTQKSSKQESSKQRSKGNSKSSSDSWSFGSLMDKASVFMQGPMLMLIFTVVLGFLVIAGEDYNPDSLQSQDINLYEVLGVDNEADVLSIRKAYKNLALTWHPDKNPNCEACAARFATIGEAYEILNNPEKRKAYDQRRAPDGSLESIASVDLTAEDFESRVLRSNDIWYVEVYNSNDGMSKSFHPMWEDFAQTNHALAHFGRVDVSKHRNALRFFPQRVLMFPVVWRFVRGQEPEMFQPNFNEVERSNPLAPFIQATYPEARIFKGGEELKNWWSSSSELPRILISGPVGNARGGRGNQMHFSQVVRATVLWSEFFDVAFADSKIVSMSLPEAATKAAGTGKGGKGGKGGSTPWSIALRQNATSGATGSAPEVKSASTLEKVLKQFQEVVWHSLSDRAPHLTIRNYGQLCGGAHTAIRTYCCVMVDAADETKVKEALAGLKASRLAFAQEALEIQNSGDEEGGEEEEPFHIQVVQVSTSSSRLPWKPVAAGSGFNSLWSVVKKAPFFVFEAETRRLTPVWTASLGDLYQQIAYDDLKFSELPESHGFGALLSDPEAPLQREFSHFLATPLGAAGAFMLAALASAILPEFSWSTIGATAVGFAGVLLVSWPLLTRRCLEFILFR